ncbi:class I SAM-dependent DNA methyltransferase [Borreliella bavariensis]|uniref:class I SAM-dependent DNA methyltransferase n=1 Tax=Borreliella bavariensis TaxID=664662 RepID=UPI001C0271B6|nr:class I SAM-dependent DNA methyltransferase [Borreliella bavariensis]
MKTNNIVKTNDPNISLYKELSEDFIKKENINKLKDFFILIKNKLSSIDDNSTEANIESLLRFIFEELNYSVEQQKGGQIEGVESRVDILLFENDKDRVDFNNKLEEAKKNNEPILAEDILLIVEVKRPSFSFDTKNKVKEAEDQLYRYLNQYQKHYGILSNGKIWRLYDKSKILYGEKRYIEFDFSKIEKKEEYKEQEWFILFIYLIRKERYLKTSNVIEIEKEQISKEKEIIQKTLREILYERPDDSIVFKIAIDKEYRAILKESEEYDVQDSISKELVLKRMLLKKCIYGVDINPISVEITMLSLWINTFIFGTPLSFIEHHIKVGNALLGYTKDEFFDITKKKFESGFSLFKKRIKEITTILEDSYQKIKGINDTTKEDIEKSKKIYKEYEESEDIDNLRIIFSLIKLYSLSFDKSLNIEFSDITTVISLIENILVNKIYSEDKEKIEKIRKLSSYYKFFHYGIEFPDIEEGFDIVIGNPPWEKTKFDESEFFSKHIPNYRKLGIKDQNKIKQEVLSKDTHPLKIEYNEEKNSISTINNIYKSDFKDFTSGGDPNLFRYFIRFNLKLIKPGGNLTYLTPSALWSESSSRLLRKHIFTNYKLNYIYQFQNQKRFKDVVSLFKFVIFQLSNTKSPTSIFKAKFMIQSSDNILKDVTRDLKDNKDDPYKGIELNIDQIKKLSPIQESIIEFKDNEEFSLINKMFSQFGVFSEEYIDFQKGVDPSINNRKSLLKEYNDENFIFLYSGANIHQFNSRFFICDDAKERAKLLWIDKEDLKKILTKDNQCQTERVFYRDIARNTDVRTMISTLSPKNCYCVNSMYINYEKTPISIYKKLFIISIFNSLAFDFLLRRFVNIHVQKSYLYQCPMPQPEEKEILSNSLYLNLAKNTSLLVAKNDPGNFKYLLYLEHFKFSKEEVDKILNLDTKDEFFKEKENENNFIVASLYSLTKEDFIVLLNDFNVLKNKKGEDYILSLIKGYENYLIINKLNSTI